ncbi:ABC transporter permease [Rhizobium sp. VS19-DR104.2]|uniref:ABC transporter permease n=1 Tax=unclassified Rhizobium TaxID=2613769 RepID=UPI001C5BAC73|nr:MULTISPECIES: ABC transporter permease [unclassified Rhizobium]MBZ5763254.1 ABC transporter permease [Rhizobium sp. VS19-DR96]MBZ5769148.1 ABC transporter permease [Rhizobium sp. VS19-DR129.2]MBZ5776724.1 ABC transporter permease [Rhizobium sp. VS19-DRK62.2]MBZ5787841.1 ABC transporter permease [Rhizobium sp. VS19-DR121]MBZ5805236.1 ABC transporter permease [Rhizobium sp. VS19-DR181]
MSRINHASLIDMASRYGIAAGFVVLCIFLSFASPYFATWDNIGNILAQVSINGIMAVGLTFVILAAGIDLSVGSILALAGIVSASVVTASDLDLGMAAALLVGLAVGAAAGAINGAIIAGSRSIPPFIVTLGMLSAGRGLTQIYNHGSQISDLSDNFMMIGNGQLWGIQYSVYIFAVVAIISFLVLKFTRFGRYVYAVGGNERGARTAGVNIGFIKFSVYLISGVCAALSGIIFTSRATSASLQAGLGYELDAIAAVVIGGTSLAGGRGGVVGTILGALLIGVINNGLDLLSVDSGNKQVIKGLVIVSAVFLDTVRARAR